MAFRLRLSVLPLTLVALLFSAQVGADFNTVFDTVPPEQVGMSSERLQRLDNVLKSYIDNEQLAGQVALVLRQGKIVFSAANGMQNIEAGIPMREDSIFRIASQTKAITSVAIMMLHERGELDISDPLSRYLPEWREMQVAVANDNGTYTLEPARRQITLRHLLTHTGGMSYGSGPAADQWAEAGFQGWYFANRDEPIRESIRRMAALPLDAHPGEVWIYGYNTDILGAVVEEVSGQSLATFFEQEIFQPLGMSDTHFFLPQSKLDRLNTVYQPVDGGIAARPERDGMQSQGLYVEGPRQSYSGGAGLLSTAQDYARFLQMLLNGGEFNDVRLLSPKSVELMVADHIPHLPFRENAGQGFGLGFYVVTDLGARGAMGSVGEYGWGGAYHSTYWVDPAEELIVIYLTQIIPATGLDDYSRLRSGVYQAIVD